MIFIMLTVCIPSLTAGGEERNQVREHTSVSPTIYLPSAALNLLSQFIGSRSSCLWPIKYLPKPSQSLLLEDARDEQQTVPGRP